MSTPPTVVGTAPPAATLTRPQPPTSSPYVDQMATELERQSGSDLAARITRAVAEHDAWRASCLSLLASDGVMSRRARELMDSDLATRVAEGFPGLRDYPSPSINAYADELEAILILLARELYRAPYVEWRAPSICLANALALWSMTRPGDRVLVQDDAGGGGNFGYQPGRLPDIRGLESSTMPVGDLFDIDIERLRPLMRSVRPKVVLIGGSSILFPYALADLRQVADEVGAAVIYDAAHVGLLIATGEFQDALSEGADVMTTGTNKISGGPLGGLVLSRDRELIERIMTLAYPGLIQARDLNKLAAAALALAEMRQFGAAYARQAVRNAQTLAGALAASGFRVLGADRGFTRTHQIFIDLTGRDVPAITRTLISAGILVHPSPLPRQRLGEPRRGMRLSVQEPTRRGMREPEMQLVADWFRRLILESESAATVRGEVSELQSAFSVIQYSFDPDPGAGAA